jgi:hypothetical protein
MIYIIEDARCSDTEEWNQEAESRVGREGRGGEEEMYEIYNILTLSLSNKDLSLLRNTQRSEKGKRRKGKRAITVAVVALCRSARRRSIISQRWSPFCALVVRQQVIVKLFEVLKGRTVPSVGIRKILTSNPFGGMRE